MSPLPSGRYIIKSVSANKLIGRPLHEDLSLNPKRVELLTPEGGGEPPVFDFKVSGNETKISTRGAPTAAFDNRLWAILLEQPPAEQWIVQAIPQAGPHKYIITKKDRVHGWVLTENEPHTQISVRPLIIGPSEPPFYPPNQVWEITPVNYD